jgi:hypothetical protein
MAPVWECFLHSITRVSATPRPRTDLTRVRRVRERAPGTCPTSPDFKILRAKPSCPRERIGERRTLCALETGKSPLSTNVCARRVRKNRIIKLRSDECQADGQAAASRRRPRQAGAAASRLDLTSGRAGLRTRCARPLRRRAVSSTLYESEVERVDAIRRRMGLKPGSSLAP